MPGPVFAPVAVHKTKTGSSSLGQMTAVLVPAQGKITLLDMQDGSLVAEARQEAHHTAACALQAPMAGQPSLLTLCLVTFVRLTCVS